jgi:hypothetical protein
VGGTKPKFIKKKRIKTSKVFHDDPSTHFCMCCEDWDTDYEPEYPRKAVINHCATCANPWDITCESDSFDDEDDDARVGARVNCLSCDPADRQMYVRGRKCKDTTCYDRAIEGAQDTSDINLDEIEPRNAGNIRRHPQEIVDGCNGRQASIDHSGIVRRDHSEVCAFNEEQLMHQDDEDSLAISIFLNEISEDIDLTRTVSRHQLGIPGWLYLNTTMDKESSDVGDVVQIARPATTRTNQSRENGSLGCSTANLDHMQENGRRDSPQDDRVNDKKGDVACAMDVKNGKEYDVDGDRIPFYWPPFRKGPPTIFLPRKPAQMEGGRRKVSPPDHYDQVIIEWCCGHNS